MGKGDYYVPSVIALYWVVSISMVYLNKMLVSSEDSSIPAPMFITWYQCVITVAICRVLGNLGESARRQAGISFFTQFPAVEYSTNVGMQVMPLSVIFVGMIAFNNLCLKYVEVSFYNVARSLSMVFNVVFTYLILGKQTSLQTCGTLLIIILGFLVGIDGEVHFNLFGTACGVIASLFVCMNSIYTAKILPKVDGDKNRLLFYNNFNAAMLFLPLIVLFEGSMILENISKLTSLFFWFAMTVTGIMGFCIGLVTVMQIKATSPLTHNISGTAKAAAQSILAFYIWQNPATTKGLMGIAFVLGGSGLYTWVQMQQRDAASKKSESQSVSPAKV